MVEIQSEAKNQIQEGEEKIKTLIKEKEGIEMKLKVAKPFIMSVLI